MNCNSRFLTQLVILFGLSVISSIFYHRIIHTTMPLFYHIPKMQDHPNIGLHDAFRMYLSGHAVFLDTRYSWEYQSGHIRNAKFISYYESFDQTFQDFIRHTPKSHLIVTYCQGQRPVSSDSVAYQLRQMGYQNVYAFFNGWNEWERNNCPITVKSR